MPLWQSRLCFPPLIGLNGLNEIHWALYWRCEVFEDRTVWPLNSRAAHLRPVRISAGLSWSSFILRSAGFWKTEIRKVPQGFCEKKSAIIWCRPEVYICRLQCARCWMRWGTLHFVQIVLEPVPETFFRNLNFYY